MSQKKEQAIESRGCTVGLPQGMHLRPVQRLATLAESFESVVQITTEDKQTTLDGVFSLMTLGLAPGAEIEISARGPDARQSAHIVGVLVGNGRLLAYEDGESSSGSETCWCTELANIAEAFDSQIILEAGDLSADARVPDELSKLTEVPEVPWRVRAIGPDARCATAIMEILLNWLGKKGAGAGSPG